MALLAIKIPKWDIEEETGYKPFTTFWQDFSIADRYGLQAIQDTFNRAFDAWKDNSSTSQNLCLYSITRYSTTMYGKAQKKKTRKPLFTMSFGTKPTTTH